jgi:hypothetical protein
MHNLIIQNMWLTCNNIEIQAQTHKIKNPKHHVQKEN